LTLLARLGVFSTSDAWVTFSGAFAALLLLSGGQLALLLDWRRWCGRRWVEVAKHCDAVHWAGAGVAVVMLVARFATRVSLEENIAGECDVLGA
jgi:hypothetical protein